MGSNIGKDQELCSFVTQVVKEVARVPVWAKLTPATSDIALEAGAVFRGGADAVVSSNTFPSLPLIDPETLEFEMNVEGLVSSGGLGGPAILPLSLAKMSQMTRAFPEKSFSGIGGISEFRARPELLPPRLRHRAGLHRGHARPRGGPERRSSGSCGMPTSSSRRTRTGAGAASRTSWACGATASCRTRRSSAPSVRLPGRPRGPGRLRGAGARKRRRSP